MNVTTSHARSKTTITRRFISIVSDNLLAPTYHSEKDTQLERLKNDPGILFRLFAIDDGSTKLARPPIQTCVAAQVLEGRLWCSALKFQQLLG